jgi:hypothetical protein
MKKLITILAIATTLFSCSNDEEEIIQPVGCNCDKVYYQYTATYNPTTGVFVSSPKIKTGQVEYNFTNDCNKNLMQSFQNMGQNSTTAIFRGYIIECK